MNTNLNRRIEQTRRRIREVQQRIREMDDELFQLKMQLARNTSARGTTQNFFDSEVDRYLFNVSSPWPIASKTTTTKEPSRSINLRVAETSTSNRQSTLKRRRSNTANTATTSKLSKTSKTSKPSKTSKTSTSSTSSETSRQRRISRLGDGIRRWRRIHQI